MVEVQKKGIGNGRLIAIAILIVLLVISNTYIYVTLQSQITPLTTDKANLQVQVNTLTTEKTNIQSQLNSLNNTYQSYESTHTHTNSEYNQLNTNYLDIASYYGSLSDNVTELYDLLYSYSVIPNAFNRTLNNDEVQKTSSSVLSAGVFSTDLWPSFQKIYDYTVSNIEYVQDIDMPYPSTYWQINIDGFDYVTNFTITTYRNYVQTPILTLNLTQGDCDDQAILAYAMTKYYMKYIYLTEYPLYITHIEFSSGMAHLAVMLPVEGGKLCILDTAGNYLTSTSGFITSKEALSELQAYSNYWSTDYGSITYMELYNVSITDGSHTLVAKGDLNQIAGFLS